MHCKILLTGLRKMTVGWKCWDDVNIKKKNSISIKSIMNKISKNNIRINTDAVGLKTYLVIKCTLFFF